MTEIALQPLQFPNRPDVPWLALEFPHADADGEPFVIDEDKLLYTASLGRAVRRDADARPGCCCDELTEMVPSRTEDTGLAFHVRSPELRAAAGAAAGAAARTSPARWRWADLVDGIRETMDLAKKRAIEPDHIDGTPYARFLPALISAVTLYPITASLNLVLQQRSRQPRSPRGANERLRRHAGHRGGVRRPAHDPDDHLWNRLEGRPRTHDFKRALAAEIRDPLFLLTKQWQMGEFQGDDAGSPITAKVDIQTTRLTKYKPAGHPAEPFADDVPLEAKVEQRPIPFGSAGQPLSLDIRSRSAGAG